MAYDAIRVGHLVLRTPTLEEDVAFLTTHLGQRVLVREQGTVYLADAHGRYAIGLVPAPAAGVHHLGLAIAEGEAEALARRLEAAGGRIIPAVPCLPGWAPPWRVTALDPDGRVVECYGDPAIARQGPLSPLMLSHVVLNTADIDRAHRFYTEGAGLSVSDWTEHQMVFLRSGRQHHVLAVHQQGYPSVNHIAWEAGDREQWAERVRQLTAAGVEPLWGPGRHGPGNNLFCYVRLPSGFVLELVSELEELADPEAHRPRVWQRVGDRPPAPDSGGLPSAAARAALAGEPDPGWAAG